MKKDNSEIEDDLRPEYKRSDLGRIVRGKYAGKLAKSGNVVILEPDVAKAFADSAAVNEALRSLLDLTRSTARLQRRSKGQAAKAVPRQRT